MSSFRESDKRIITSSILNYFVHLLKFILQSLLIFIFLCFIFLITGEIKVTSFILLNMDYYVIDIIIEEQTHTHIS